MQSSTLTSRNNRKELGRLPTAPLFETGDWTNKKLQINECTDFIMFIQSHISDRDEKLRGHFLNNRG